MSTADLTFDKLNAVWYRVDGHPGAIEDLRDAFKFRPANYRFHPRYKAGIWDGFVSLFDSRRSLFPVGLTRDVKKWASEMGYEISVTGEPKPLRITPDDTAAFLDWLDIRDPRDESRNLALRDYQRSAVHVCLKHRRVNVESPTSSGKTVMTYALSAFAAARGGRALLIVPNVMLVNQTADDFVSYGTRWPVQKIYSGMDREVSAPIVVSTWQSLQGFVKTNPKWFEAFDTVILDEAHGAKEGAKVTAILKQCVNAERRYGLTGTFPEDDLTANSLVAFVGPVYRAVTITDLMEKGHVAKLKIVVCRLEYSREERSAAAKFRDAARAQKPGNVGAAYHAEMEFVKKKLAPVRNRKIASLISRYVKKTENALVLFSGNEFGRALDEYLDSVFDGDRSVFLVYGEIDKNDREEIKKIMKETSGNVLVASYQTFSTGISIPNLHHVIFATPSKSQVRVLQSIGRGIRLHDGKEFAVLWDLVDDLGRGSYSWKHAQKRLEIYAKQGFEYVFRKV